MVNPRPRWCPHTDCEYIVSFQDACCGGKLPNPEPHDESYNTHRFCILTETVFDLQVNSTDIFVLSRLFESIKSDMDRIKRKN